MPLHMASVDLGDSAVSTGTMTNHCNFCDKNIPVPCSSTSQSPHAWCQPSTTWGATNLLQSHMRYQCEGRACLQPQPAGESAVSLDRVGSSTLLTSWCFRETLSTILWRISVTLSHGRILKYCMMTDSLYHDIARRAAGARRCWTFEIQIIIAAKRPPSRIHCAACQDDNLLTLFALVLVLGPGVEVPLRLLLPKPLARVCQVDED